MANPLLEQAKQRAREGLKKIEQSEELVKAIEASGLSVGDTKRKLRHQKARLKTLSEIRP